MIKEIIEILFQNYCLPNVEIIGFNVLIDGKFFFGSPVKKRRRSLRENY